MPVTVDLVATTVQADGLKVLVVRRAIEPYLGQAALPGGFVLSGETLEQAARREMAEETGVEPAYLEQLRSYGPLGRDPRGPVLTVAYLAIVPAAAVPQAGSDAAGAGWWRLDDLPDLAFDHAAIVADGIERLRAKLEYSPLATVFCGDSFTIAELRAVYEAVWGQSVDQRNFHRKATGTPGFLVPTGQTTSAGPGRPAELFRRAPDLSPWQAVLYPPILRPVA